MPARANSRIPFSFVLEYLTPLEPKIRPMFGCHALYLGKRLVLVLRQRESHPEMNGVWIATKREHHESLRKIFPSMRSIEMLGRGTTNWQVLSETNADFESSVIRACALVVKGDPRIGTIPKTKGRKK